jgi:hypothetical protein
MTSPRSAFELVLARDSETTEDDENDEKEDNEKEDKEDGASGAAGRDVFPNRDANAAKDVT